MHALPAVFRLRGAIVAWWLVYTALPLLQLTAEEWNPAPLLERLDRDGNGHLTQAEIPVEMRDFVAQIAMQTGLDSGSSIKLQSVRDRWSNRMVDAGDAPQAKSSQDDLLSPVEAVQRARMLIHTYDLNGDGRLARAEWQRLSPAWGEDDFNGDETLSLFEMSIALWKIEYAVPDEGRGSRQRVVLRSVSPELARLVNAAAASAETPPPSAPVEYCGPKTDPVEQRRLYASELLRLYDRDGDNVLTKDEWDRLGSSWRTADSNRDGRLTVDEMAIRFRSLQEGPSEEHDATAQRRTDHQTTALPGLPREFHSADRNGDGQVQMHEFSETWDETVVRRFQRRDIDGDGVITPKEWRLTERE